VTSNRLIVSALKNIGKDFCVLRDKVKKYFVPLTKI